MSSKLSHALATSAGLLLAACTKYPPDCEPHQVFNPTARSCAVRCGTREAPAHPQCYDVDSGMLVSTTGDAAADAAITDAAPLSDASDVATADSGDVPAPRQVFPMSLVVLSGQQPTLKWALAEGTDGASIELCRDRAMSADCQRWTATGSESRVPSPLARGVWFWRLAGRSGAREGAAKSHTWSFWSSGRPSARDASYAQIPDINGDGLADVVFVEQDNRDTIPDGGAPLPFQLAVQLGRRAAAPAPPVRLSAPAGAVVGGGRIADTNADGFGDFVGTFVTAEGRSAVAVYFGSPTGFEPVPQTINSPDATPSFLFGVVSLALGDTNGDGFAEFAFCSPAVERDAATPGRCHIFTSSRAGIASAPTATVFAPSIGPGTSFEALETNSGAQGDINGDGFGDLVLVSSQYTSGERAPARVWVFPGSRSGLPSAPAQTIVAPTAASNFGGMLSVLGDQDGDGRLEVSFNALLENGGTIYVFRGGPEGIVTPAAQTLPATEPGESTRYARVVGDINGDGLGDVSFGRVMWPMFSAPKDVQISFLLGGAAGVTTTGAPFASRTEPSTALILFPELPHGIGDVDGDGLFDIIDSRRDRLCFGHATGVPDRCAPLYASPANYVRNAAGMF